MKKDFQIIQIHMNLLIHMNLIIQMTLKKTYYISIPFKYFSENTENKINKNNMEYRGENIVDSSQNVYCHEGIDTYKNIYPNEDNENNYSQKPLMRRQFIDELRSRNAEQSDNIKPISMRNSFIKKHRRIYPNTNLSAIQPYVKKVPHETQTSEIDAGNCPYLITNNLAGIYSRSKPITNLLSNTDKRCKNELYNNDYLRSKSVIDYSARIRSDKVNNNDWSYNNRYNSRIRNYCEADAFGDKRLVNVHRHQNRRHFNRDNQYVFPDILEYDHIPEIKFAGLKHKDKSYNIINGIGIDPKRYTEERYPLPNFLNKKLCTSFEKKVEASFKLCL